MCSRGKNVFILTQGNTDLTSLVRGSLLSPWARTLRDRTTVHPADTPGASPLRQPWPASRLGPTAEPLLQGRGRPPSTAPSQWKGRGWTLCCHRVFRTEAFLANRMSGNWEELTGKLIYLLAGSVGTTALCTDPPRTPSGSFCTSRGWTW